MIALSVLMLVLASCSPVGQAPRAAAPAAREAAVAISASELEQQYGARVSLLAVTAVGGLVDLRMQILDAAKAQQLFQGHAPSLNVEGSAVVLAAPEDSQAQVRQLQDGGGVFVMYPNVRTVLKRGDKVTVDFGNVQLQSIVAK